MRIQKAFGDLHPVHRSRPDMPLQLTPEQCASLKNLYLKTDLGVVDCLDEVLGVGNFEEVFKHSVEVELPCGKCRILDIETLIRAKEAMNRDHDRITVKFLKEIIKEKSQN
jgi:molybdopterin/thiamine biosynthesis adenylyltransferase